MNGPIDYFQLFVCNDTYENIANETNKYAELCQEEKGQRDKYWIPTWPGEIRAFFGLIIMMGAAPRHTYEHYWKDDDFLVSTGFKSTMTRNRYEKLSQYLHVNSSVARERRDSPNYHPVNKIRPIYDVTRSNFQKYYQHSTEISIDEAMKGYKGRSDIRQYMPEKGCVCEKGCHLLMSQTIRFPMCTKGYLVKNACASTVGQKKSERKWCLDVLLATCICVMLISGKNIEINQEIQGLSIISKHLQVGHT